MVLINIPMPQNCEECPMNHDWWICVVTNSYINLNTCESERLPDCPLKEVQE